MCVLQHSRVVKAVCCFCWDFLHHGVDRRMFIISTPPFLELSQCICIVKFMVVTGLVSQLVILSSLCIRGTRLVSL